MSGKIVNFRDVLFKKGFFLLWLGQIISEFGDRLNQMALVALVYSKAPGSAMALSKIFFFIIIPVFIVGPFAGVYVDRWDRKKVLIISDIARGCIVLFIPFLVVRGIMLPVYMAIFAMFSVTRFFIPSKMAVIPLIVSKEKLLVANSLANTTRIIATMAGFAAAGFIVKLIGYYSSFYLDSASFFISASFIAMIAVRKIHENAEETVKKTAQESRDAFMKNVWEEILEGFHLMRSDRNMRIISASMFLLMAGVGSIFCVLIVFIQEIFGSATAELGIFGAFLGVGLFLGTLLFGRFGQKTSKIKAMFASFSLCGIFISAFSAFAAGNPGFLVAGLFITLIGIGAAPVLISANTLIHRTIPDRARGRVFSSMEIIMHLAFLVFMFLASYLTKFITPGKVLTGCGIMFACAGIAGQIFLRRETFDTQEPE